MSKHYVFQYPVLATVDKVVEDLKKIVEVNPGSNVSFSDVNGSDFYIKGIQKWNSYVILRTSWDEDDAITVDDLLEEFMDIKQNGSDRILIQYGWELRGLDRDDGAFFHYDEEGGYNWINVESNDIRLLTAEDLNYLMKELAAKYPDRKLVGLDNDGKAYDVFSTFDDDGICYICVGENKDNEHVTASDFIDCYYWTDGGVVARYFKKSNAAVERAIEPGKDYVFFEYKLNDEDVIAFRMGETLYDSRKDDYDDDDFFSDKDIVTSQLDYYDPGDCQLHDDRGRKA